MLPCHDSALFVRDVINGSAASVATSPKKTFAPEWTSNVAVAAPMPVAALKCGVSPRAEDDLRSVWAFLPGHHNILAS
jgi:hypothetical protein